MNAIPEELVTREEKDTDVVHDHQDALVDLGAVTETQSGFFGPLPDSGGGFRGS